LIRIPRIALVLAVAMIMTSLTAVPASADPGTADPGKLARVITDTGSGGVKAHPKGAAPSGGFTAMASGCTTTYHNITGVNGSGQWLWRLEQNTYWCWDGTYVTYASRTTPAYTYGLGWRFGGLNSSTETGVGTGEFRGYVQAQFYRCMITPFGELCYDHVYPWIQSILRGNGTSGGSAGT